MKQSILDLIGEPAALEQLAEEAAELAQAALKLARVKRAENYTPVTKQEAMRQVIEELTDVILCATVADIHPDLGIAGEKLLRWERRLGIAEE